MSTNNYYEYPGHINILEMKLISMRGVIIDLITQPGFLVEFNLVEDIFSNFLQGQLTLVDSVNLVSRIPITGEEYLYVKAVTPGFDDYVFDKVFRVYSLTNREILKDTHTQTFTLHFCSIEAMADINKPLFLPFEGNIPNVASYIFNNFLASPQTVIIKEGIYEPSDVKSTLTFFGENNPKNHVQFISPGWNPATCINWLAARSIPQNSLSCSFMFFETTQGFYFTNLDSLLSLDVHPNVYTYSPLKFNNESTTTDILQNVISFSTPKIHDHLSALHNGYYANRVYSLDLLNKKFNIKDYNYFDNYYNYKHPGLQTARMPILFEMTTVAPSPAQHTKMHVINDNLFSNFDNNVSEQLPNIYGHRIALLQSIRDTVFNFTIYGKTDLHIGQKIIFDHPNIMYNDVKGESKHDPHYSGIYLITCLRHRIQMIQGKPNHTIIMEAIKDNIENRTV